MLYRILTENKNLEGVKKLTHGYFRGFTVYQGIGSWQGQEEKNLTLEIEAKKSDYEDIKKLSNEIKKLNSQEAILIQRIENRMELI